MDIQKAREIVIADTRQSYPEMTDIEAIDHAINTVDPDNLDWPTPDDEIATAYSLVLKHGHA